MKWISFPGLGIEPFKVNRVAFNLFGREVMWYGVIICIGIILAFFYSMNKAKKHEGIITDTFLDLVIFLIPISVICARIYYVIFYWTEGEYESFLDVIAIWEGGLAIYGGIIGGFLTILVFAKIKKIPIFKLLDAVAPGVLIGQIIGRWGNFVNGEAHGGLTDILWRMGIQESESGAIYCYHPTFLYESLWNLIGFLVINALYKKKKFDGQIFFLYITWYGLGRGLIELLRTDSLMLFGTGIRVSSLLGFICFFVGGFLLIRFSKKAKNLVSDQAEYKSQFVATNENNSISEVEEAPIENIDEEENSDNAEEIDVAVDDKTEIVDNNSSTNDENNTDQ